MKALVPLLFAPALLVVACDSSTSDKSAAAASNYRCDSGEVVIASYPSTESATVHYKGRSHSMKVAVSGSGARYVGDKLEWWTKGSGAGSAGTLFRHETGGTTGESIERCTRS